MHLVLGAHDQGFATLSRVHCCALVSPSQPLVNHSNPHPSDAVRRYCCGRTELLHAQARDCTSNHELLDLRSTFKDGVNLCVTVPPLSWTVITFPRFKSYTQKLVTIPKESTLFTPFVSLKESEVKVRRTVVVHILHTVSAFRDREC